MDLSMETAKHVAAAGLPDYPMISVWDSAKLRQFQRAQPAAVLPLMAAIDELGMMSRISQGLGQVLTSVEKLGSNTNQRLYLISAERKALGILKVGCKKLFIRTATAALVEIDPLCVLDFFVHDSCQRSGLGKLVFEAMLNNERVAPEKLAYDRPSPKLIGFLRKYFGLSDFVPQSNNFVVFQQYFTGASGTSTTAAARSAPTGMMSRASSGASSAGGSQSAMSRENTPPSLAPQPNPQAPKPQAAINLAPEAYNGPRTSLMASGTCRQTISMLPKSLAVAQQQQQLARGSRREQSPTRSAVDYDIITLAGGAPDAGSSPGPQPATNVPVPYQGRPAAVSLGASGSTRRAVR